MSNMALDLRPQEIGQLIGQESLKKAIKSFAEKDNWPNVFLLYGPPGTGKTTTALIIAKLAGADEASLHEINASTDNGVDAAREISEISASCPLSGQRRVIILNEAHRLTAPAQDALKDPMERGNSIWILTTDDPSKISAAIRSRAAAATFELRPLRAAERSVWVTTLLKGKISSEEGSKLLRFLHDNNVGAPREILGVLDQFLAGVPLEECLHDAAHEPLYKDVAGAVLNGNWTKASAALAQIKTADARGLIGITSAFFRNELVKCPMGPRARALAQCLKAMDALGFADGSAYGATVGIFYLCCETLTKETK